jgi:hypothetical protein
MSRCWLVLALLGAAACEFPRPADVGPPGDGGGNDDGGNGGDAGDGGGGGDGGNPAELGPFEILPGVGLNTARSFHAGGRVGTNLFLFGGISDTTLPISIERAALDDAQSTIDDFTLASTTLDEGLTLPGIAVMDSLVYVMGGEDGTGNTTLNMERADIVGNNISGMTAITSTLSVKRSGEGFFLTSAFGFLCGGVNIVPGSTTNLKSCERTTIGTGGTLGTFNSVASPVLVNARTQFATVVIGDFVYVIGGGTNGNFGDRTVERARINANGSVQNFEVISSQLVTGRESHGAVVLDGALYVVGGRDANLDALDTVERAPILGDGSLGAFEIITSKLATPRYGLTVHVVGNAIIAVGGQSDLTNQHFSVERAVLQ